MSICEETNEIQADRAAATLELTDLSASTASPSDIAKSQGNEKVVDQVRVAPDAAPYALNLIQA